MALIEFDGVCKRYPGSHAAAVDELNLHIESGEFLTLLGPSGSGKTTTLMLLAGFEAPSSGAIRLDGVPIERLPPHLRNMGVVFQSYSLFPHMTVAQNVAFPLSVRKVPAQAMSAKVEAALAKVHLQDFAERKPHQLSGGQQQRVALARALVFEPRVVLMDEPLSALDKKLREEMQLEIRKLHRELGVTMVFVTHDQSEAMTLSDRVAVFNHGRIEQLAAPQVLYDAPANPFVANFLGDNNVLSGTLAVAASPETAAPTASVRTGAGHTLQARISGAARPVENAPVQLCVRPEFLQVAVPGDSRTVPNALDVTLTDIIHQGDHWRLVARLRGAQESAASQGRPWFAKISPAALPAGLVVGQNLCLGFRPEDAWIF
ncbi:ABC transporter ATP-binding protein [Ramlibacter sp. RBP-2]|uniref:Spermidine/putrescine import ATP-binding protein PotA n=1 Tax=Ramlibacter lithotrophicus TaxID=2606681 RepID=A0A7X6DI99_9BURK|nr:ABC transporter ATP-binding protein [Ramlibacter lithotrophicus]NKE67635.1 ABC transporter ATP-binding protein [Ramlibacter lithotrophicus]